MATPFREFRQASVEFMLSIAAAHARNVIASGERGTDAYFMACAILELYSRFYDSPEPMKEDE